MFGTSNFGTEELRHHLVDFGTKPSAEVRLPRDQSLTLEPETVHLKMPI